MASKGPELPLPFRELLPLMERFRDSLQEGDLQRRRGVTELELDLFALLLLVRR